MSTHLSHKIDLLFKQGRFGEIVATGVSRSEAAHLEPEQRVQVAHALLYSESGEHARELIESCQRDSKSPALQSRCQLVLALLEKRAGDISRSTSRLQQSVRLAQQAGDLEQAAWSQLHLFRLMAEGHPHEVLSAALADSRRLVTKAGRPHLAAFLHDCVALMEAQTGRLDEATRHFEIERSILARFPNAWLEQLMHINAACIAFLNCDFEAASKHCEQARGMGILAGTENARHVIDLNEAHIHLLTGRFSKAARTLQQLAATDRTLTNVAALDGLARLYLALNRLDECDTAIRRVGDARVERGLSTFYAARWLAVCQAKLLLRRGSWERAAEYCNDEIARAQVFRDTALQVALRFLKAEAVANTGDMPRAGALLFEASELGVAESREYVAHFYDSCANVLGESQSPLARTFRERADRVWRNQGNVWAQVEAESRYGPPREIQDTKPASIESIDLKKLTTKLDDRTRGALIVGSIRAALDLAFDPELSAIELTKAAAACGCAVSLPESLRQAKLPQNRRALNGGTQEASKDKSDEEIQFQFGPFRDSVDSLIAADIKSIARFGQVLAARRNEVRNSAALWPAGEPDDADLFTSEEMATLVSIARRVAPTNVPVLITGETGTGKEILARAIHAASTRAAASFLPFNCSGGPRDMIDAQLFGHRRGAFTGAVEHASGVIRAAAGGTLFLDEIGDAPPEVQPKLLRFLESGEIHPIGEPKPVHADVRVIAATNVDLDAAVSSGRFREDLFYRLNIVRLHLPPLRERRVEIPVFAHHYLLRHARELGKGNLRLAEETMEYLLLYRWPGNVRQLANEMRRLAALAETDAVLMPEHLSPDIVASRRTVPASERTLDANEVVVRLDQPLAAATEHLERAMLLYALKACRGRMEDTARQLGLSRKGLYLKRVRFGLEPPEAQPRTA